jgi:hypothetical protein
MVVLPPIWQQGTRLLTSPHINLTQPEWDRGKPAVRDYPDSHPSGYQPRTNCVLLQ